MFVLPILFITYKSIEDDTDSETVFSLYVFRDTMSNIEEIKTYYIFNTDILRVQLFKHEWNSMLLDVIFLVCLSDLLASLSRIFRPALG